jgi:hypothetical protein
MPEPKSHAEHRPAVEQLLRRIPGFRGYLEKAYRRESDALQRQLLAERLEHAKAALTAYSRQLVDAGQLAVLPQADRVRAQLDKLIGRIRGAMQGYSGVFDLVQVKEALLDRIYENDVAMLDKVDAVAAAFDGLSANASPAGEVIAKLSTQVGELDHAWDHRADLLRGLE